MNDNTNEIKLKECTKCKRELPMTLMYFRADKRLKSGLRSDCKECCGSSFTEIKKAKKGYKICADCERELLATKDNFTGNRTLKDGLNSYCKMCKHKRDAIYRKNNREKIIESELARQRRNKEHVAKTKRKYRKRNKDKIKEYFREYAKANADKFVKYTQKRNALKKQLPSTLSNGQWEEIKEYFHHKCAYCNSKRKITQDHFVPLSKGGEYTHNNIIPACTSCNSSKHNKSFFEWYPNYEHYSKQRENKILNFLGYYKSNTQQLSIF